LPRLFVAGQSKIIYGVLAQSRRSQEPCQPRSRPRIHLQSERQASPLKRGKLAFWAGRGTIHPDIINHRDFLASVFGCGPKLSKDTGLLKLTR